LKEKLELLDISTLNGEEIIAFETSHRAIARRVKELPDDDWHHDLDDE